MKRAILFGVLPLAGCGSAVGLKPPPGQALPVPAYGAEARPSYQQLVTPTPQQRPQRSDELLTSSDQRRSDEFDLPPR